MGLIFWFMGEATAMPSLKAHLSEINWDKEDIFNGLVVVAKGKRVISSEVIRLAPEQQSFTLSALTRIGSISKQITAYLILELVAARKLNLHKDVLSYLPEDIAEDERELLKEVTLHQLLSHTSGYDASKQQVSGPGKSFNYANWTYKILGRILENITGQSFQSLCHDLFKRAGMTRTFVPDEMPLKDAMAQNPSLISGFRRVKEGSFIEANPDLEMVAAPVGGIIADAKDLVHWAHFVHVEKALPQKLYQSMVKPYTNSLSPLYGQTGYGYGVYITVADGLREYAHHGLVHGYRSILLYYPDKDMTVVIFVNSDELEIAGAGLSVLQKLVTSVRAFVKSYREGKRK